MGYKDKTLLGALLTILPGLALAQLNENGPAGQETVQIAQAGTATEAEFEALLKEIEGLEVYNALLERQIQAQQQELLNIQAAIQDVPEIERQLPPLLLRMVDGLDDFVGLDVPFLPEERNERVANLQLIVERSDINDAEKFRRIMEAWQVETEYGSGYATYVGQLDIGGTPREVDFFQLGRVALFYQTTDDEAQTGAWDPRENRWVALGNEHRNSVRRALQMARNQIAPELVLLPIIPSSP